MALAAPYRRALIWIVVSIVVVGAVILAVWVYLDQNFESANDMETPRTVMLAPGSSVWGIADTLYSAGVLADPNGFAFGVWRSGRGGA